MIGCRRSGQSHPKRDALRWRRPQSRVTCTKDHLKDETHLHHSTQRLKRDASGCTTTGSRPHRVYIRDRLTTRLPFYLNQVK
jgi:hypothetical protein